MRRLLLQLSLCAALLGVAASARAAVIAQETFDVTPLPGDWTSRDGEMAVSWNSTEGNPPGSIQGTFTEQDEPSFESDAFRVDAAPWVGNYNTLYPGFTQFQFDFMAEDILPSTFIFRISDGTTTFIRNLLPQVTSSGSWLSGLTISLAYDGSWVGGSASDFANVMANVSFFDIQIGRNGIAEQDYFVDNFYLMDDPLPINTSAIPEANSFGMILLGSLFLRRIRKEFRLQQRAGA